MVTLTAGIVLSIIAGIIVGWWGFLVGVGITAIIILSPIEGLGARNLVAEIPLLILKRPTSNGMGYYVEKGKYKATYAFDNRDAYAIEFEAYEEKTVAGIIKVYESQECTQAVLKIFKRIPRRSSEITFAPFPVMEYVFLVPEGMMTCKKAKNKNKVV